MDELYALKIKSIWQHFKKEHFSFWMICGYLVIEYVRPQSIIPSIDFLPWAQVFLLGAWLGWLADRKSKWVAVSLNKWMVIFLLVIIAATYTAQFPEYSKKYFMNFFSWFVIYFAIIQVVNTKQRFYIFILIYLFASFKISFSEARIWTSRGFSFTSWGLQGPPGYFTNSGELAILMLVYAPLAYQLYSFIKPYLSRNKKYMMLLMPVTAAMTVMGASSRGGQIGMVVQIYQLFLKGRLSFKSIALTAVIVGLVYYAIPDQQKQRFASTGKDKTSEQRLLYWQHGWEMMEAYPMLGVGYFNFIPYYEANFSSDLLYDHAELPHNIFIQIGTDAGFMGLSVYLMLIYQHFALNRRTKKAAINLQEKGQLFVALAKGLDIGMWGFLIAGQFVTVGYYPFMWINLALSAALHNICRQEVRESSCEVGSSLSGEL